MDKIPILLYHNFCSDTDKSKNSLAVTWDNFKKQMDWLYQNAFTAVSLEKIVAEAEYWRTEEQKSEGASQKPERKIQDTRKKVVLTFDGGDLSDYHFALPVLKEKGFCATFFVTINEIGKPGKMDWPMVYDLSRQGMGVASGGLSSSFLTAHNNYTVLNDLLMSKQILEKYIRKRVDFLSAPGGFYNRRVLAIARDVGFKGVCVSDAGLNDFLSEGLFLLKRFAVRKNYGLNAFRSIAAGQPSVIVRSGESIRAVLRKTLGYQVWEKLENLKRKHRKKAQAKL
ncbi:MAG TPA: hypothetical protein DCL35_03040 [Candidatus Omnitrophica bacterium]|nr:hypothetical protein [Candidatus Omnitrophota bacterium]